MSKTMRILVVDDVVSMAKALGDIQTYWGHSACVASSGLEALDLAKETTFDCPISDIRMPDMDGVELYRTMKTVQPGLPGILMTAYVANSLVEEGLAEGAMDVLTKPVDIERLRVLLETVQTGE